MYLIPKSEVNIGDVRLYGENRGINSLSITQSLDTVESSIKVVVPLKFGEGVLKAINFDKEKNIIASIRLGYNGKMYNEFYGYLSDVNRNETTLEFILDEWHCLKGKMTKSFNHPDATLKKVLETVFEDYKVDIEDENDCYFEDDEPYHIDNKSAIEVIRDLKDYIGFSFRLDVAAKKLSIFRPETFAGFTTHTYVLGTKDEKNINALRSRKLSPNVVKNELNATGADKKTNLKKITGFGYPPTRAGDALKIVDIDKGTEEVYLIQAVAVTYSLPNAEGKGGFRRENTLSHKIKIRI